MHLYSIYIDNKSETISPTIIKQGFSLWALIFNVFWALYHKMWCVALIFVLINFVIFTFYATENLILVEKIAQCFIFGFFAIELREFYAKKQGLTLDDVILANSEEEAEVKYIMRLSERAAN